MFLDQNISHLNHNSDLNQALIYLITGILVQFILQRKASLYSFLATIWKFL